jgi:hypothetical protein
MSAWLTPRAWPTPRASLTPHAWLTPRAWLSAGAGVYAALLVVGASIALTCVTPARSATASGSQAPATITASFQPDRLGAVGAFTVTIDLAGGAPGDPTPLRRSLLRLPAGLGVEVPRLRSCAPERLRLLGVRGCPAQSRLGVGRALVRAPLGSQLLEESISLSVFLGPLRNLQPTFAMLAQGYTPFDERVVLGGTVLPDNPPYGEDLVLSVPAIPTLALEPDASIASMSLTIGSTRRSVRESNTTVEPTSCPPGGFPFAAELTYADGSIQNVSTTTPCPR